MVWRHEGFCWPWLPSLFTRPLRSQCSRSRSVSPLMANQSNPRWEKAAASLWAARAHAIRAALQNMEPWGCSANRLESSPAGIRVPFLLSVCVIFVELKHFCFIFPLPLYYSALQQFSFRSHMCLFRSSVSTMHSVCHQLHSWEIVDVEQG